MQKNALNPTPDQTFELAGDTFIKALDHSKALQTTGRVEEACNERYRAVQQLEELLPDNEEINLEWNHRNSRAALELVEASAIDHFLINDFEMSAALLELLLELDPEDHLEACELLAFDYLAMDEHESFDEVINDLSDKSAARVVLLLWSAHRREGRLPDGELRRFKERFAPYYAEFSASEHPADEAYLRDIESERPTLAAQARELWLRTENLWALWPDFIDALKTNS